MNTRMLFPALLAVAALAALHLPDAGAAPKRPVALQYDEIVRMAIAPNTPPPPGAFSADYATIMGGATAGAATPTPAPPKHRGGLFGQIAQIVTTGVPDGSDAGEGGGAYAAAMDQMKRLSQGSLSRYTYYKNWVRVDDPVAQTATISKCDLHQFITLDLAHKTYRIANTAPVCAPAPAVPGPMGRPTVENEAPGTGDVTFKNVATNLGPKTLEGIPTIGWDRSFEYSATNSTGSCRNGDAKMTTESYVSQIVPPRRYCPLPKMAVPTTPESVIVHGGCKPRLHGTMSGFAGASDRLEMYAKMTYGASQGGDAGGGFASVTERGHVAWLQESAADALFSVPPGFTKQ